MPKSNAVNSIQPPDPLRHEVDELLRISGRQAPEALWDRLARYASLILQWNDYVSLVSKGDLAHLWTAHIVDSLSLTPYIAEAAPEGALLDIGSGGGFPAIPLALMFPDRTWHCLERTRKKCGFLQNAKTQLELPNLHVVEGSFPQDAPTPASYACVTARAVEKPERLIPAILAWLPQETAYLCQHKEGQDADQALFHVEPFDDAWSQASLRRGRLMRIARR